MKRKKRSEKKGAFRADSGADSALLRLWLLVRLKLSHVEFLVNHFRRGLDFRAQLLFDAVEVEPVLVGDEIDGQPEVPESARSSDSV